MVESSCKSSGRVGRGGNWGEGPGISIPRCSRVWRERATTCVGCGRANRLGCHGWSRGRSDSTGSGRRRRGILPTNLSEYLGVSTQVPLQGGGSSMYLGSRHTVEKILVPSPGNDMPSASWGGWSPDPPPQLLGLASKSSRGGRRGSSVKPGPGERHGGAAVGGVSRCSSHPISWETG